MRKLPISAIVVSFNEGHLLARCLASIDFCEEIIVVDLGSTDNSVSVAEENGARVIHLERSFIIEEIHLKVVDLAQFEFLLFVDPDEMIDVALAKELGELFSSLDEDIAIVSAPCIFYFKNRQLKGTIWGGTKNTRPLLIDRRKIVFQKIVHRGIQVKDGYRILYIPYKRVNVVHHFWMRDYRSLFEKHLRYIKKEADHMQRSNVKYAVTMQILETVKAFHFCFIRKRGYADYFIGFCLSLFWSWYRFASYSELRKLSYEKTRL